MLKAEVPNNMANDATASTRVSVEGLIALAVLNAGAEQRLVQIEEVSELFAKAARERLDVERVALRRLPGGRYYSDDVEAFVGNLLSAGLAVARSPIRFEERGKQVCRELVQEELANNRSQFETVAAALGLKTALP